MSANVWVFTFASVPRSLRECERTIKPKELKFKASKAREQTYKKLQF